MRVALVGVGNCASALVQGVKYYSDAVAEGLVRQQIGPYKVSDISFGLAFDVDERKINLPLKEAIFSKPNCCMLLDESVRYDNSGRFDCPVFAAPIFDGVANHMRAEFSSDQERFYVNDQVDAGHALSAFSIVSLLQEHKIDVLINYLPVGSQIATEFWANACISAKVPMVNCIPVFIASNPEWANKFRLAEVAIIGDDMKSQFGASVLSQMFQELAKARGHKVLQHIQQNSGGNTDFLNMTDQNRLASKKISKENVLRDHGDEPEFVHAGPSDYIRVYGDTKVAHFHLELSGFCGAPVVLDARLQVQDSPNSAGVVIDALRYARVAQDIGVYGPIYGASAFTQKSPPLQMTLAESIASCEKLASSLD